MNVDLAPDPAFRAAVLAGVPLAFALNLDPGAVDPQVQWPLRSAIRDVDLQNLLAPLGECFIHLPGNAGLRVLKFGTARFRSTSRIHLSTTPVVCQRAMPKHLHRQAGLDGCAPGVGLSVPFAARRCLSGHSGIKPALRRLKPIVYRLLGRALKMPKKGPMNRQRATALQRVGLGGPVSGLGGRGCGSVHPAQLPHWIHEMNPSRDLRNRAVPHALAVQSRHLMDWI